MMRKTIYEELESLKEELDITDDHLKELWHYYSFFDFCFRQLSGDSEFLKIPDEEQDAKWTLFANYMNMHKAEKERIIRRFINYCKFVNR